MTRTTGRSAAFPGLPPALSGERREFDAAVGRLSYYASTHGARPADAVPLLLIHSVNAAASAYEVRPLYEHYRATRPVYALDLPGYGFSDRSERPYEPRLMTDAVLAMVAEIRRLHGPVPIDALAVSLSAEFLARAAAEQPASFRTVALVSPTGFSGRMRTDGPPGSTLAKPGVHRVVASPAWRRGLFGLLTRPGTIRYFLRRTYGARDIDAGLAEYAIATSHQPGAEHAPLYFLSGYLFSADSAHVYRALRMPVWMTHGVRGDFVDYGRKLAFASEPNWRFDVFQTGALPHFEQTAQFIARYDAFLPHP